MPQSKHGSETMLKASGTKEGVKITRENSIATLTLNRPEVRNAFDEQMILLLSQQLRSLENDPSIKAVVIRGEGDHFCAGANIEWMRRSAKLSREENHQDALKLAQLLHILNHLKKPTLAVVQGSVYGGAIGLITACDIVIAETHTEFCFSEVKLGLIPSIVCPYILAAIGAKAARRYLLTAEKIPASLAERLGLVHELCSKENINDRVETLLLDIKRNGPEALKATKELIFKLSESKNTLQQVEYTAHLIADIRTSAEAQEGLTAFLEKRIPEWQKEFIS